MKLIDLSTPIDVDFVDHDRSAYLVDMNSMGNLGLPIRHTFKTFCHKGLPPSSGCRQSQQRSWAGSSRKLKTMGAPGIATLISSSKL